MLSELTTTGISVIGDMPWGTHFCCFYETEEDLLDTSVPFFQAGLVNHEFCLWIVYTPITEADALRALKQAIPSLDRYLAEGGMEIRVHPEPLFEGDIPDPRASMRYLHEKLDDALERGYAGMRVGGSPATLQKVGRNHFLEFERELAGTVANHRMIALCQFPLAESSAGEILDAAGTHQLVVARRHGKWVIIETPEIRLAKAEIAKLNEQLEQRVEERTRALEVSNGELRKEIVQRERVEQELRQKKEILQSIFDHIPVMINYGDGDFGLRLVNRAWEKTLGWTVDEIQRDKVDILVENYPDPQYRQQVRDFVLNTNGEWADFKTTVRDGRVIDTSWVMLRLPDGTMLGLGQDITWRKRAEEALRESEERFRNLADTAPVMIWIADPDKLCTYLNKCSLDFAGDSLEQKIGDGWIAGIHPEDREAFLPKYSSWFNARQEFQTDFRLRRADGEYRWVLTTGVPRFTAGGVFAGYIGSCVDITDMRRKQEQDVARHKLESIGVLAGGIAHDFNNLLAGVLAEAELAASELKEDEAAFGGIQRIRVAAARGAEIVRELMTYSGQDKAGPVEPVDLSQLVEEMLELLKISVSKHAVLKIDLQKKVPAVRGNSAQLRQIVMNLVINASEAIGEQDGVISVTTSRIVLPRSSGPDLPPGAYLNLEVSDTGCGMTAEVQSKVFDPFFSTKFAGRGLGLAVVQGIVRDHGGAINIVSAPGQGTKFEIFLLCVGESAQLSNDASAQAFGREHLHRAGTVLVVEDEDVLRVAVSKMLRKHGFGVIEAIDGSSALELVRAAQHDIDVMLLDMTLPGVSSREVFEKAQNLRPNLKVILTSAYGRETVDATFAGLRVERFIRKPFKFGDLMGLFQDALSA